MKNYIYAQQAFGRDPPFQDYMQELLKDDRNIAQSKWHHLKIMQVERNGKSLFASVVRVRFNL